LLIKGLDECAYQVAELVAKFPELAKP